MLLLQVWNPCFDVTPGSLIEGIITEEGVVPRDPATGTHKVADFMAVRQQHLQQNGTAEGTLLVYGEGVGWLTACRHDTLRRKGHRACWSDGSHVPPA